MFFTKTLLVCLAAWAVVVQANPQGLGGFGAPKELSGAELEGAKTTLIASLTKLAAGDGPNYRLNKILSASTQVVAGSSDKYRAELVDGSGNTKLCNISIWSRSWLPNGIEVTFECDGEAKLVKTHNA